MTYPRPHVRSHDAAQKCFISVNLTKKLDFFRDREKLTIKNREKNPPGYQNIYGLSFSRFRVVLFIFKTAVCIACCVKTCRVTRHVSYVYSITCIVLRSQTDFAGRQTPAIKQLLQQSEYQLFGARLLLGLRLFSALRAISQTGHGVCATPSQEIPGVLLADERHDSPERTEIPRLPFGLQIELANIQIRHEIDDALFHGERF